MASRRNGSGKRAAEPVPQACARESEPAAEWVKSDRLKPWAGNPRKNNRAVAKVARSIKRFGFGSPIVARQETGEVISGHTRLMAARKLGLAQVPVRWLDLDAESAHKLAVADNRIAQESKWDTKALGNLLSEWGMDADLGAIGFDDGELDRLLDESGSATEIEELDCSDLEAVFFLAVEGPLGQQADVLEQLKVALEKLPGVEVSLSVGG